MLLTREYSNIRLARQVVAFTKEIAQRLLGKYLSYYDPSEEDLENPSPEVQSLLEVNEEVERELPGKGDLVAEWILKNLQGAGINYARSSVGLAIELARFYFNHVREPRFKQIVQDVNQ